MWRRRWVTFGLMLACTGLAACSRDRPAVASEVKEAPPLPVEVVEVQRSDLVQSVALVGSVEANESAQIHPEMAGVVRAIHFAEGQRVRRGELLVELDDAEINAQLAQAEAADALAQLTLTRIERLRRVDGVAEAAYDQAVADSDSAAAQLRLLRTRAARTRITAPFDGIVDARQVSPGDYVTSATLLTSVSDLSRLKLVFEVPERFLAAVAPGSRLQVRTAVGQAAGGLSGEVYFVSSSLDRETRAATVKAWIKDAPSSLKPGMFANVDLILAEHAQALVVPEAAIANTPDGPLIVLVRSQGKQHVAAPVPVRLGLRRRGWVEVESSAVIDHQLVVATGAGSLALFAGTSLAPRMAQQPLVD